MGTTTYHTLPLYGAHCLSKVHRANKLLRGGCVTLFHDQKHKTADHRATINRGLEFSSLLAKYVVLYPELAAEAVSD